MPVTVSKVSGGYQVRTPNRVHAKRASLKNAKSQERLLNAVEHGWKPTRNMSEHGGNAKTPAHPSCTMRMMKEHGLK